MESNDPGARRPFPGESRPIIRPVTGQPASTQGARSRGPAGPPDGVDRRRSGWSEFRHAYPGIIATMGLAFTIMLASDIWLVYKHVHYSNEVNRLRSGMSDAERKQADAVIATEQNKFRVMVELVRRQAQGDKDLHLSIEVDSARMMLEREGALLREMPVEVAPAKVIGSGADTVRMSPPRGARTVEKVLEGGDWEIPKWVYTDRALPVESNRRIRGALGPIAILLSGGTVIYAMPSSGPLADPTYLLPGSIRARTSDLKAIAPNLKPGSTVYFY